MLPSNTESVDEIIRDMCFREGDINAKNFLKYKSVSLPVFNRLNLQKIRHTKRALIEVDQRTNTIEVPCDFLHLSSMSFIDGCAKIQPMYLNKNIQHDIVDIDAAGAACEHGCAHGSPCHTIKSYEKIVQETEELMPDGSYKTFTSITRKRLDSDGVLVTERTFPVREYDGGNVWVDVHLKTETEILCALEVDAKGCVCDTEENRRRMNDCAGADTFALDAGCALDCFTGSADTYNISEQGTRFVFPSTFSATHVLLRYFYNADGATLRIPKIAKEAFIATTKEILARHKRRPVLWEIQMWEREATKESSRVELLLNRYSIAEFYSVLAPQKEMP
jgi:hypothetical protein